LACPHHRRALTQGDKRADTHHLCGALFELEGFPSRGATPERVQAVAVADNAFRMLAADRAYAAMGAHAP
jgi:hypothetical protein